LECADSGGALDLPAFWRNLDLLRNLDLKRYRAALATTLQISFSAACSLTKARDVIMPFR
jgi:hypothetical protein